MNHFYVTEENNGPQHATTPRNEQTSEDTNLTVSISMVSLLIIIIVIVGVAFFVYIAYHNWESVKHFHHVQIASYIVTGFFVSEKLQMCGSGGRKKGRPKRKDYKYLKSLKDALS
jgi:hypothetical protein